MVVECATVDKGSIEAFDAGYDAVDSVRCGDVVALSKDSVVVFSVDDIETPMDDGFVVDVSSDTEDVISDVNPCENVVPFSWVSAYDVVTLSNDEVNVEFDG